MFVVMTVDDDCSNYKISIFNISIVAAAYQYYPESDSSSSDEDYSPAEDWKKVRHYYTISIQPCSSFFLPQNNILKLLF